MDELADLKREQRLLIYKIDAQEESIFFLLEKMVSAGLMEWEDLPEDTSH